MKRIILILVALVAMAVPATASASYNITQRNAERQVKGIAEYEYGDRWGVEATASFCKPQGYPWTASGGTYRGYYHRWTCIWGGYDGEGAEVYGHFIVAGQSDGTYRYQQVLGGLRWD